MSIVVICPTRGRVDNARQAYLSFLATKTRLDTTMVFAIDDDDPEFDRYRESFDFNGDTHRLPYLHPAHAGGMGNALNAVATRMAANEDYDIIGFIGDDHRFRTMNWDRHISDNLESIGGGIAYGNDLFQSANLPTQVFISRPIIATLGWMALPGAKHLYLDDTWKILGEALDRLLYFPQLVIEHMHPAAGKAAWDANYERVNDQKVYSHDAEVFARWKETELERDVQRVRAVLEHHGDDGGLERSAEVEAAPEASAPLL